MPSKANVVGNVGVFLFIFIWIELLNLLFDISLNFSLYWRIDTKNVKTWNSKRIMQGNTASSYNFHIFLWNNTYFYDKKQQWMQYRPRNFSAHSMNFLPHVLWEFQGLMSIFLTIATRNIWVGVKCLQKSKILISTKYYYVCHN
jgi:hypothetical protein